MLGRAATLGDAGNAAALAASDRARTMTAATVNISRGALLDYAEMLSEAVEGYAAQRMGEVQR